jgi:hypothetical protein
MTAKGRLVAYYRVATLKHGTSGLGIEAQTFVALDVRR